ncbi:radical SAM enzyme [Neoconidiobolus thromboides FSU 785]|nr:radical SAM enzyme [Neoconidiobolus thromboides FSU 785]
MLLNLIKRSKNKKLSRDLINILDKVAIYIHWPYCESKCSYCSFNKYVNPKSLNHQRYKNAYLIELKHELKNYKGKRINSVYFGGGTPTLAEPSTFEAILKYIDKECKIDENTEITIEVNPTSMEMDKLKEFKFIGINRMSLGLQSIDDKDLKMMGRDHDAKGGLKALEITSKLFDNFTFDMIFGRPEQTIEKWRQELKSVLSFGGNHISIYQLMIEAGTPFYKLDKQNKLPLPKSVILEDMYYDTIDIMNKYEYEHYEVSSYSKKQYYGKHNMGYWSGMDYIGIGPGAHGRVTGSNSLEYRMSTYRILSPNLWLNQCELLGNGVAKTEILSPGDIIKERIVLGLRTKKGVNMDELKEILTILNKNIPNSTLSLDEILIMDKLNVFIKEEFLKYYSFNGHPYLVPTEKGLGVIDTILYELLY